jgi:hypothetical protein
LFVIGVAVITACDVPQSHAQQVMPSKILTLSDAEHVAFTISYLDWGMPVGEDLPLLVLNRSALILPIPAKNIEQVLRSANPQEYFSNKNVDPPKSCRAGRIFDCRCCGRAGIEGSQQAPQTRRETIWLDGRGDTQSRGKR